MKTKSKILVIDDDPTILEALEMLLQDADYRTETSTRDGEFLEKSLRREMPDLIILDILLSGHDGREICKKIKSQDATRHIPVILISAHPDAESTAFAAGAEDFLAKPFDIDDLLGTVARHI